MKIRIFNSKKKKRKVIIKIIFLVKVYDKVLSDYDKSWFKIFFFFVDSKVVAVLGNFCFEKQKRIKKKV